VHQLLERGELLLIFPEGTVGIGKGRAERFRLREWRVGHVEMAIRHRAPVVPVAVVGPDEQYPLVWRVPLKPFGAPYLPISPHLVPLPVRYVIRYGEPIAVHEGHTVADADDPVVVQAAAERVRLAEQALIDEARATYRRW
jgi:1-acyl-sn-glycerol-3-phosphate acyltransferase